MVFNRVSDDGEARQVECMLEYNKRDPYAIRFNFGPRDSEYTANIWVFDRRLAMLVESRNMPVGIGDIHLQPHTQHEICLTLSSDDGTATFTFSREAFLAFILDTTRVVPPGCENKFWSVDELIRSLLAE